MQSDHGGAGLPQDLDSVWRFPSEVAGLPLLDAESEARFARTIEQHRRVELLLALRIPCVARSVLEHWQRQGADAEREPLASAMGRVAVLLARQRSLHHTGASQARRQRTEAQIAHLLASTGFSEGVRESCLTVREGLDRLEREGVGGRELEATAGLPVAELGERMRRIELHRAVRDRAAQRFVEHNLRLAQTIARRYRHSGVSLADLIQEANLGLIRAVGQFDSGRGVRFSTYARWPINEACIRAVQNQSRTVRVPVHVHQKLRAIAGATRWLEQRGRPVTREEIASLLEIESPGVERLLAANGRTISLDAPVPSTGGPGEEIGDWLAERQSRDPAAWIDRLRLLEELRSWLSALDARERRVVYQRFGLQGQPPRTLREVGEALGVSHELARQIEARAIGKLRRIATLRGFCREESE